MVGYNDSAFNGSLVCSWSLIGFRIRFNLDRQGGLLRLGAARVLVIGPQPAHQAQRLLLRPIGVQRHQSLQDFRVSDGLRPAVGRENRRVQITQTRSRPRSRAPDATTSSSR